MCLIAVNLCLIFNRKYNLDVYVAMTHAPGLSAYNYVERRMAPLSKALSGVVIEHATCGTHLDVNGKIIDSALQEGGEVLSSIWGELVLDGKPVVAEYVADEKCATDGYSELWVSRHCRVSQYILQVNK